MAKIGNREVRDVAAERLAALRRPKGKLAETLRDAMKKTPGATGADAKAIKARQEYEKMAEGDVSRGRGYR